MRFIQARSTDEYSPCLCAISYGPRYRDLRLERVRARAAVGRTHPKRPSSTARTRTRRQGGRSGAQARPANLIARR